MGTLAAFERPQNTIEWARSCIKSAYDSFITYTKSDAFIFVTEDDPETSDKLHKFKIMRPLPREVEGHCSNALVDIKHSFDQSLFAAAQSLGALGFDKNYPWADSPNGLWRILEVRQRKPRTTLPQVLIDEIWRQEPYATGPDFAGGNDFTREIAGMVNDKHSIGFALYPKLLSSLVNFQAVSPFSLFEPWDPVKQEMVICRVMPGGRVSYANPTVTTNIRFDRTGEWGQVNVFAAAWDFADRAHLALEGFKAVCAANL